MAWFAPWFVLVIAGVASPDALAATKLVTSHKGWSLWCEEECRSCTLSTVARQGGDAIGNGAFLTVHLAAANSAVVSGYLAAGYRQHSLPDLTIDGERFELFAGDKRAWAVDTEADMMIIKAMQRGLKAVISGVSNRGRITREAFSLDGFSAIWRRALKRCGKK